MSDGYMGGHGPGAVPGEHAYAPADVDLDRVWTGVAAQVSLTTQSAHAVLAVPVSGLLALAEGGYGLEVVEPSGAHRLVAVTTGIYAGSQVQIAAAGIGVGTRVVVAQ